MPPDPPQYTVRITRSSAFRPLVQLTLILTCGLIAGRLLGVTGRVAALLLGTDGLAVLSLIGVAIYFAMADPKALRGYPVTFPCNSRYLKGAVFIDSFFLSNLSMR